MEGKPRCGDLPANEVSARLVLLQSMFNTLVNEIEQLPELTRDSLVDTLVVQLAGVMTYARICVVGSSTYPTLISKTADGAVRARALELFFDRFHQIRMEEMGITT